MCSMIPKKLELHNIETKGSDRVVRQCCKCRDKSKRTWWSVCESCCFDNGVWQQHSSYTEDKSGRWWDWEGITARWAKSIGVSPFSKQATKPRISSRIKAITSRQYSGKRISTVMKMFAARSSICFQASNSRSLQNGMLKQTPQNQIANKV